MKRLHQLSLVILAIAFIVQLSSPAMAQKDKEIRKSLQAGVTQTIGADTEITIKFSRPGVKGRTIWGDIVPYGMYPGTKYSKDKPYPWRAGADENTTIECNNDVLINGHKLPAGKYGIHMIPSKKDWTVIFSKKNEEWGSYSYDKKHDALRISAIPEKASHQEWLTFDFENLEGSSALAFLHWEKLNSNVKLYLITNGLTIVQRPRIKNSTIGNYFEGIIISEEVGFAKPQKEIFDIAFDMMGNPNKDEVLIIGDSLSSDITGGINYGIDTCWYNPDLIEIDNDLNPTYEIQHLLNLIKKI